jgi:hypothetical protein
MVVQIMVRRQAPLVSAQVLEETDTGQELKQ